METGEQPQLDNLILGEIQQRIAVPLVVARTGLREGVAIDVMAELLAA